MIRNSQGKVFYGMHFYPGVAEYRDGPDKDPYRIFINEDTIRAMSPTFAGRPIYVQHVSEVETQPGALVDREADGYVVESFFNAADGKTWAKVIIVTEQGESAIRNGWKFSNAYIPKSFGAGGLWNGVSYQKQVTSGEFEHLAIVPNPRYEDSPKIFSPEEFKLYNEERELELKKLANSQDEEKKETKHMSLSFFRRKTEKVENSLEGVLVQLPKSKKEISIEKLVNDADDMAMMDSKDQMCNGEHMVEVEGKKMKLNELLDMHKKMNDELDLLRDKKPADKMGAKDPDIKSMDNDEDEAAREKALALAKDEKKENEEKKAEDKKENEEEKEEYEPKDEEKKKNSSDEKTKKDRANFEALKNAHNTVHEQTAKVILSEDMVARGKARYGSN